MEENTTASTESTPLISTSTAASSSSSGTASIDINAQREGDVFPLQEELEEDISYMPWSLRSKEPTHGDIENGDIEKKLIDWNEYVGDEESSDGAYCNKSCGGSNILLWTAILVSIIFVYACMSTILNIRPSESTTNPSSFSISSLSIPVIDIPDLMTGMPATINNKMTDLQVSSMVSPSLTKIKVACVGDSLTYGYGASTKGKSYPGYLQSIMGRKFQVGNFGADGVTAIEYPKTHEGGYVHTHGYYRMIDFVPDFIVAMLGTNDSKRGNWNPVQFENDLSKLLSSFEQIESKRFQAHPRIYLVIPPRLELTSQVLDEMQMQPTVVAEEIPKIIKRVAYSHYAKVIDLSKLYIDPNDPDRIFERDEEGYWTGDGVHPNDWGYKRMATKIANVLLDAVPGYPTEAPTVFPTEMPVSKPSIYPTNEDVISEVADVVVVQSKSEAASPNVDLSSLQVEHLTPPDIPEIADPGRQIPTASPTTTLSHEMFKLGNADIYFPTATPTLNPTDYVEKEEKYNVQINPIQQTPPNMPQITDPGNYIPSELPTIAPHEDVHENMTNTEPDNNGGIYQVNQSITSSKSSSQIGTTLAAKANAAASKMMLPNVTPTSVIEDSHTKFQLCKFTFIKPPEETMNIPTGCALIAEANIGYLAPGKKVPAVYICATGDSGPLILNQESLIHAGLVHIVNTPASVGWTAEPDGSFELQVSEPGHEDEELESSGISYINPGPKTKITWYTGVNFDGKSMSFTDSFHPELTSTGFGNDNIHSLILESTATADEVPGEPMECKNK